MSLLLLISAIAFIVVVCLFLNKIVLPLILKIFDLPFDSPRFRLVICLLLAGAFCTVGVVQFKDFMTSHLALSRFFPLSFLVAGIFVFLGLFKKTS